MKHLILVLLLLLTQSMIMAEECRPRYFAYLDSMYLTQAPGTVSLNIYSFDRHEDAFIGSGSLLDQKLAAEPRNYSKAHHRWHIPFLEISPSLGQLVTATHTGIGYTVADVDSAIGVLKKGGYSLSEEKEVGPLPVADVTYAMQVQDDKHYLHLGVVLKEDPGAEIIGFQDGIQSTPAIEDLPVRKAIDYNATLPKPVFPARIPQTLHVFDHEGYKETIELTPERLDHYYDITSHGLHFTSRQSRDNVWINLSRLDCPK